MAETNDGSPAASHIPPEALRDWLAELQQLLDIDEEINARLVLDVARDVARGIARPAAPLTTFVLGLAVGRHTPAGAAIEPALAQLARTVQARATDGVGTQQP